MPSLYEHAGGDEALHRLEELFYDKALADPVLKRLFPTRQPHHVDHLTWFTAESFGGPDRFSRELGFGYLIDVHRGLKISEEERQRFAELYMEAVEAAGLPGDEPFREAVRSHIDSGRGSRSRTRTPPPTPTSIRFARFRGGSGRETSTPSAKPGSSPRARVGAARRHRLPLALVRDHHHPASAAARAALRLLHRPMTAEHLSARAPRSLTPWRSRG
jgi:hemoglobin